MGIIDDVKSIASTVQQIDNIELYRKILNLQAEVMELVQQNTQLRIRIGELEKQLQLNADLKFSENVYWLAGDGPYCSACWDVHKRLVRMQIGADYFECPSCKNFVNRDIGSA